MFMHPIGNTGCIPAAPSTMFPGQSGSGSIFVAFTDRVIVWLVKQFLPSVWSALFHVLSSHITSLACGEPPMLLAMQYHVRFMTFS